MARKILCLNCDKDQCETAKAYGEYHESVHGEAIRNDLQCDNCGKGISTGEVCAAAILLSSTGGNGAGIQKPSYWAHDYIQIKK